MVKFKVKQQDHWLETDNFEGIIINWPKEDQEWLTHRIYIIQKDKVKVVRKGFAESAQLAVKYLRDRIEMEEDRYTEKHCWSNK